MPRGSGLALRGARITGESLLIVHQDSAEVVAGLRVERLEESTEIAFFVDEIGQLRTPSLITVPRGATLPNVRRQGGHRWDHVQARSLGWPWVHPG